MKSIEVPIKDYIEMKLDGLMVEDIRNLLDLLENDEIDSDIFQIYTSWSVEKGEGKMQKLGNVYAFLNGTKDVVYDCHNDVSVRILRDLFKYPSWEFKNPSDEMMYLVFKGEDKLNEFLNSDLCTTLIECGVTECHEELGLLLGFPPKATSMFPIAVGDEWDFSNNIGVTFQGMYFMSYKQTLKDDFDWLLENKPLVDGMTIEVGNYKVIVGESNWIDQLHNIINKYTN